MKDKGEWTECHELGHDFVDETYAVCVRCNWDARPDIEEVVNLTMAEEIDREVLSELSERIASQPEFSFERVEFFRIPDGTSIFRVVEARQQVVRTHNDIEYDRFQFTVEHEGRQKILECGPTLSRIIMSYDFRTVLRVERSGHGPQTRYAVSSL